MLFSSHRTVASFASRRERFAIEEDPSLLAGAGANGHALPNRPFLATLAFLAAVPVLVPYVTPRDDGLFLYPYMAILCLGCVLLCMRLARHRTGVSRLQWFLMALHFACVGASYAVVDAQNLHWFPSVHYWVASTLNVGAKMVALLAVTTAAADLDSRRIRYLDSVLATTLPVLQFVGSYSGTYGAFIPKHLYFKFLISLLLALISTAAWYASGSRSRVSFARIAMAFLWADVVSDLVLNLLNNEWLPAPRVVPFNMLFGLSTLFFCYLANGALGHGKEPETIPRRPWTHSVLPGLLVMVSVLLVPFTLREHPVASVIYIFVIVAVYTVRTHLLYRGLMEKQVELRSHAGHLARLATRDALTGIGNRRSLDEDATALLGRIPAPSAALILVDTDHFKHINDAFGHSVGDDILCLVAESLSAEAEKIVGSSCARLGGDEFVALLPNTDISVAEELAQHARKRVQEHSIYEHVRPTISVGIAAANGPWTLARLLQEADEALYRAKSGGRNCVIAAAHNAPLKQGPHREQLTTLR